MMTFKTEASFPIRAQIGSDFVSHLSLNRYAPKTVLSYISALNYFQKLGGHPDLMAHGLIKAQLKSLARGWHGDRRLPITAPILFRILEKVPSLFVDPYQAVLLRAMILLGFLACLRLSEMTAPTKNFNHTLRSNAVSLPRGGVQISFSSFKHARKPLTLFFPSSDLVQVVRNALTDYLAVRPANPVYFFALKNGAPVPRLFLIKYLKAALQLGGFPVEDFSSHSLRLGGATNALMQGASVLQVQRLGRWSSMAFQSYLRPFVMQLTNLNM